MLAFGVATGLAGAECSSPPSTSFELDVSSAIASQAAWYEIGLFANACPSSSLLVGGLPLGATVAREAFPAKSTAPPVLGLLAKQSYGLAAVARASDCSVIAIGCSTVSVSGGGTLSVSLAPVSGTPLGACETGSTCDLAECIPAADASAPPGASCLLQLVGEGPLADPFTDNGNSDTTILSAPAISATPNGFLIAYREYDPVEGNARLTTIAIDPSGASGPPIQMALPGACVGSPETDATALVFAGPQGTIALSQPACGADAGADAGVDAGETAAAIALITLDPSGSIQAAALVSPNLTNATLGQGHALSSTPLGILLAYSAGTSAFAVPLAGTIVGTSPTPFAELAKLKSESAGFVTGTTYGTGYVALGTAIAGTDADGGTLKGSSAGVGTILGDAGVLVHDGGSNVTRISPFNAKWASVSSVGSRILVASDGPGATASIQWSAFDMGSTTAGATGTFAPMNGGTVSYADVALQQDHAFFAATVDDSISLFAFEKASTVPIFLLEVPFSTLPMLALGSLSDGLVAVAASNTEVAVVWGTAKTLSTNDNVGGYAVFSCSEP